MQRTCEHQEVVGLQSWLLTYPNDGYRHMHTMVTDYTIVTIVYAMVTKIYMTVTIVVVCLCFFTQTTYKTMLSLSHNACTIFPFSLPLFFHHRQDTLVKVHLSPSTKNIVCSRVTNLNEYGTECMHRNVTIAWFCRWSK